MSDFAPENASGSSPPGQNPVYARPKDEGVVNKPHVDVEENQDTSTYLNESLCRQVMKEMKLQRRNTNFCDIKLIVNNQIEYNAHKCVLAANSTYFNALFTNDPSLNCLALESKHPKTVEVLLDYMYTGELSVSASFVEELIESSEKLSMMDIKQCINLHLEKNIDITNCFDMYNLAEGYQLSDLKAASHKFFVENFTVITQGKEILLLEPHLFAMLLSECNREQDPDIELYKLEAILKWTVHDYDRRIFQLEDLVKFLHPEILKKDGFDNVVTKLGLTNHTILFNSPLSVMQGVITLKWEEENEEKKKREEEEKVKWLEEELERRKQEEQKARELAELNATANEDNATSYEPPENPELVDSQNNVGSSEVMTSPRTGDVSDADTDIYEPSSKDIDKVLEEVKPEILPDQEDGNWIGVVTSRGRRTKRKPELPTKDEPTTSQEDAPPIKRGRGRPRKNPLSPHDPVIKRKTKVVKGMKRRKRGRPPGSKKYVDSQFDDPEGMKGENGMLLGNEYKSENGEVVFEPKQKRKYTRRKDMVTQGPVKCTKCPREFPTIDALKRHERGHGKDEPFLCDECGFTTIHYASIRLHQKRHTGNKFHCTFPGCTYSNVRKERFRDHMNAHQGIKEHVCSLCGKAFASRKHMQRHEKLHKGLEKNIVCEKCDWKTGRRDRLREHVVRHHPEWGILAGVIKPHHIAKAKEPSKIRPKRKKVVKKKDQMELPTELVSPQQPPMAVEEVAADNKVMSMTLETITPPPPPQATHQVAMMAAPVTATSMLEGTSTLSDEMKQYLTGLTMQARNVVPLQDPSVGVVAGTVPTHDKTLSISGASTAETVAIQQNAASDYRWYYVNAGNDGNAYAIQAQPVQSQTQLHHPQQQQQQPQPQPQAQAPQQGSV